MAPWLIERLSDRHDRSSFSCGNSSLDDFLRKLAGQYDRRNIARTYVAVAPPTQVVQGYYSLSSSALDLSILPEAARKKLPRHPVPVACLGRLAVAVTAHGQGLGATLLLDALRRCARSSAEIALHAVEVYAIDEEAQRFYLKYGFTSLADDPLHMYLSMKAVEKLQL